jgi:pyruvyltransferase
LNYIAQADLSYSGASLSPFTILGFGGVGASTVVWARNKTKRAPGSPGPPPSSRRVKVIVAATVLILACTLVRLAETAKRRTFRLAPYTATYLSQCPSPANISAPLMYYKQNWNRLTNFGDEISPALVARMTGREIVKTTTEEDHTAYLGPRLLAIGSIVHTARACDIIWGTGVRTHQYWPDFDAALLAVHALRGPNSAHAIAAASPGVRLPNVYGDPALLLPRYFPELGPKSTEKKGLRDDVLVLLHFRDAGRIPAEAGYTVLSALSERWEDVVERITAASFVVSSSLHGLIVADAYGIPARGLQLNLEEPSFKYADYYLGTQRPEFRMANSVQEALWMGPEAPPRVDLDALVAAFPGDIIATV